MKTISLKKVSAVAVASLGFGLLSVVPVNAAFITANITSINATRATASPTTGAAVVVNLGAVIPSATYVVSNQVLFQAQFTSVPTGGEVAISGALGTAGGVDNTTATYPTGLAGTAVAGAGTGKLELVASATTAGSTITSSATVGFGSFTFTPTKAGVYAMKIFHDTTAAPDGIQSASEISTSISITVAAATQLSPSASIIRMAGPATLAVTQNSAVTTLTNYSTAVDAVPRSAAKGTSAAPNNIAQVAVVLVNANGSAAGNLHTVTADITGSGLVLCNNSGTAAAGTVRSSVLTLTGTDNVAACHISSDGTAGPGTVTISVTDSVSGTKTVLGTKTFTSFGDVAKLEVSTKNFTIGRAGFTTGKAANTRAAATEVGNAAAPSTVTVTSGTSTTPAFIVKATDSLGQAVSTTAVPTIVSGTTTVVTGGSCLLDDGAATVGSSTNGVGFYNCDFSTSAATASGAKSTLTIRVVDPAGDGTTFLTTTLDVTVGGSISTETISLAATYAAGEGMTIIRSAKDSAGNPVFDGAAAPALTFNKAVGGTAPGASFYVGGTRSSTSSAGIASVFAPSVPGAFTVNATSGNSAGSALTASSSVTDTSTAASTAVNTRIDSLNAKIVALTALIAKIMKSLKIK